jgi:hypothetical protein
MHLGKVLIATSAALYLQKGDAAGHFSWLLSSRTGSTGHGELFAVAAASLKSGGVKACGTVVNATLTEVARTYTKAYVFDVLSHVCHDGTFFHEFPTKEVCLALTEKLVAEFNAEQDYVSWCKEFEQATSPAESNSTANGTNATAAESSAPEPLMNASNATWSLVGGASDFANDLARAKARDFAGDLARARARAAAPSVRSLASQPASAPKAVDAVVVPARKNGTNATLGAAEPVLKTASGKTKKHKSKKTKKKKKKKHAAKNNFKKAEDALKTALKAVQAASEAAPAKVASKAAKAEAAPHSKSAPSKEAL